jgi:hypothetical protein
MEVASLNQGRITIRYSRPNVCYDGAQQSRRIIFQLNALPC